MTTPTLTEQQREWVSTVETTMRCALFIKAGLGKTAVALEVMRRHPDLIWVVFARRAHLPTWTKEMLKWWNNLPNPPRVMLHSVDSPPENCPDQLYGVVIDETYFVKNHRSGRYKAMRRWCDGACAVILANANPVVVSVMDAWAQMRLVIGPGHTSALQMRSTYFLRDLQGFGFHELPGACTSYRQHPAVQRHSIWHHPPTEKSVRHIVMRFPMMVRQRELYEKVQHNLMVRLFGEEISYRFKMEQLIRMHQISSGAFPFVTKRRRSILAYLQCRKLKWLVSYVDKHPRMNIVIWCAYRHEVQRIAQLLDCSSVIGKTSHTGRQPNVVVSTLDMGMSTNRFGQFPVAIYFSENYKFFFKSQTRYRNDRADSQHENVTYWYLLTKNTIDEYIHDTLRKRNMTERLLFNDSSLKKYLTNNQQKAKMEQHEN